MNRSELSRGFLLREVAVTIAVLRELGEAPIALRKFGAWGTHQKLVIKERALQVQVCYSLPLSPGRVEVDLALSDDLVSV